MGRSRGWLWGLVEMIRSCRNQCLKPVRGKVRQQARPLSLAPDVTQESWRFLAVCIYYLE